MTDEDAAIGVWVSDLRDNDEIRERFLARGQSTAELTGKPVVFANTIPNGIVHQTASRLRKQGHHLSMG